MLEAAEMTPIDPSVGEFRVHYAGFFDPGFGHSAAGGEGSHAVLEVRSHEVPFILAVVGVVMVTGTLNLNGIRSALAKGFPRWLARDRYRDRWSAAYVIATVMAAWLHMTTLAFTLIPFLYFGVRAWRAARCSMTDC